MDTNLILTLVTNGPAGAVITKYRHQVAAVPPEWAAEITAAVKSSLSSPRKISGATPPRASAGPSSADPFQSTSDPKPPFNDRPKPALNDPLGTSEPPRPSRYLELLKPYREAIAAYERGRQQVGETHPRMKAELEQLQSARRAVELVRKEYQAELSVVEQQLAIMRARLESARSVADRTQALHQNGGTSVEQLEMSLKALAEAEAELKAAQTRLELMQAGYEELFSDDATKPAPEPGRKPAAATSPLAPNRIPGPPAAPATGTSPAPASSRGAASCRRGLDSPGVAPRRVRDESCSASCRRETAGCEARARARRSASTQPAAERQRSWRGMNRQAWDLVC